MSTRKRSRKPARGPQRAVTFYRPRKPQEAPQPAPEATTVAAFDPRDLTPGERRQAVRISLTLLEEQLPQRPEIQDMYQAASLLVARMELAEDTAGEWELPKLEVDGKHMWREVPNPAADRRLPILRGIDKQQARGTPADWRKIARSLEWIWYQRVEVYIGSYGEAATRAYLKELELPGSVALVHCICHCLEHLPTVKPPTAREWLATAQAVTALHAFRHGEGSHRALLASLPEVHRSLLEDAA